MYFQDDFAPRAKTVFSLGSEGWEEMKPVCVEGRGAARQTLAYVLYGAATLHAFPVIGLFTLHFLKKRKIYSLWALFQVV